MANITTHATIDLNINGTQVQQQLDAFKKRAEDLRKKFDECIIRGDTKGAARIQKQIESIERRAQSFKDRLVDVTKTLNNLDKASLNDLNKALRQLQNNIKNLEQGTDAWNAHAEKIRELRKRIEELNEEMEPEGDFWDQINGYWEKFQLAITTAVAAIVGLVAAGRSAVSAFAEMEQEMANVRKFTGMTAEEVALLNEEFKKMDTRTDREDLNKLAQEAGRLGKTSVEDVLGFVKAADKINVALDDLGEGATLTLSKLTGIFGDEARLGTEKSLLSVGSVINELSQNCSASAPYIAEFASRMGGVGAQAGMTVQQIMGFAAVLDSNEQKLEASSTALSQVIVRIYQDPAKYARVAGMDVQRFAKLVKTDMNQALIEFLATLKQAGGMDVLSPMFKDMGENGSRAISAMSTLANNIDAVRAQQLVANEAFDEATSITKEFDVQNNTVQAGLEKAQYRVHELAVELGEKLQPVMRLAISSTTLTLKAMSAVVDFIFKYKKEVTVLAMTIGVYYVAVNIATMKTILLTAATKAWAVVTRTVPAVAGVARMAVAALTNTVQYFTNGLQVNYAMQMRWQKAVALFKSASPVQMFVVAAAAAVALSKAIAALLSRQKEEIETVKMMNGIRSSAAQKVEEEKYQIEQLIKAASDETKSLEERKAACQKLNEIVPDVNAGINSTTKAFQYSTEAVNKHIKALTRLYEIQGAKEQLKELGAERAKLMIEQRQILERQKEEAATGNRIINQAAGNAFYNVSSGASMPGSINFLANDAATGEAIEMELNRNQKAIAAVDQKTNTLFKAYGVVELMSDDSDEISPEIEDGDGGDGTGDSGSGGNKDKFAAEKDWRDQMEAKAKTSYYTGLTDYVEYTSAMDNIAVEYYKKLLEHTDLGETDRLKIEAQLAEARKKRADNARAATLDDENAFYSEMLAQLKQMYVDGQLEKSEYDQAVKEQEILHQQQIVRFTEQGTKERIDAERKLQDIANQDKLKKREQFEKLIEQYSNEYRLKSLREQMAEELRILDEMLKQKLISPSEYEQMAEAIRKKAASGYIPKSAEPDKPESAQKDDDLAKIKEAYDAKLMTEEEYLKAKDNIEKYYFEKQIEHARSSGNEFSKMVIDIYSSFSTLFGEGFEKMNISQKIGSIAKAAEATFAVVNACMQSYMEYSKACTDLEVARIEKRYDAEIALAEGNVYKKKQSEKKKEKEVAKIKADAAKKTFAMQVIQAVAQTAIAALNAYSSAVAIPIVGTVLAPIAAATAIAAGMMQVATLKKQQQAAEAQGYMEGGFTPQGDREKEVGVVHAGEWVAPKKLVDSPRTRPLINLLEHARKFDTLPAISYADVSAISPAGVAVQAARAEMSGAPAAMAGMASAFSTASETDSRIADTLSRLNERLAEPFVTVNTVTGDAGIKKAQDDYNRLMKNKSR